MNKFILFLLAVVLFFIYKTTEFNSVMLANIPPPKVLHSNYKSEPAAPVNVNCSYKKTTVILVVRDDSNKIHVHPLTDDECNLLENLCMNNRPQYDYIMDQAKFLDNDQLVSLIQSKKQYAMFKN